MSVVVSYYGNVESDVALEEAIRQADSRKTSLVVVVASSEAQGNDDAQTRAASESRDVVEDRLWEVLRGSEVSVEVLRPTLGLSMVEAVLKAADQVCAEVIVLGLRPGGPRRTHIGPTAAQILLDAPCPVVTTTTHLRREN